MKQFVKNTNDCALARIDQNMQKPTALSVAHSARQLARSKKQAHSLCQFSSLAFHHARAVLVSRKSSANFVPIHIEIFGLKLEN